jgi:hypothetical protein
MMIISCRPPGINQGTDGDWNADEAGKVIEDKVLVYAVCAHNAGYLMVKLLM